MLERLGADVAASLRVRHFFPAAGNWRSVIAIELRTVKHLLASVEIQQ